MAVTEDDDKDAVPLPAAKVPGYFNQNVIKDLYRIPREEVTLEEDFKQSQPEQQQVDGSDLEDSDEHEESKDAEYENAQETDKKQNGSYFALPKTATTNTIGGSQPGTPDITTQLLMGKNKRSAEEEETVKALKNLSESGLHGKLATAQLRARTHKMEQTMSDEERLKEQEIRNEQLNSIFQMMQAQGEKFGVHDKDELVEQLKLYSV